MIVVVDETEMVVIAETVFGIRYHDNTIGRSDPLLVLLADS